MFQLVEEESAQGVVFVVAVELFAVELFEKVVERALSVYQPASVLAPYHLRLLVFIRYLAHEGLHHVAECHDAQHVAEFVDDEAVGRIGTLELFERFIDALVLGKAVGRFQNGGQTEIRPVNVTEEVFHVRCTGQFVRPAVGDGIDVVHVGAYLAQYLFGGVVRVEPHQFAAVCHDGVNVPVAEAEDALHDVVLDGLDLARVHAFADDGLNLLLRHFVFALFEPYCFGHQCRALGKQPYQRRGHKRQRLHGPCHGFRYFFRHGHADAFWDELPEDERQVGDGDDDNRFGDAVSVWGQHLRACDDDREVGGESFARIETGQNADERDADLYGGQEPVRFAGECEGCAGGLAAAAGFRLQPRPARRYQCYLGHRKDAVQNNQQQDDNDFHS